MPTRQKIPKVPKPEASAKTQKKKISQSVWANFGLALLVFGGIIFSIVQSYGGFSFGAGIGMRSYLNEKYDKEFVVDDVHVEGRGLAVPGRVVGTAHPVDDSSLTFEVGKSQSSNVYYDRYGGAVWAREERPRVQTLLEEIYGASKVPEFELTTHIATDAEPDPIRGDVPTIDRAIDQYSDDFFYSLSVSISTDVLSEAQKEDIKGEFSSLAQYVRKKGAGISHLLLRISVVEENAGYLCKVQREQFGEMKVNLDGCLDEQAKEGVYN